MSREQKRERKKGSSTEQRMETAPADMSPSLLAFMLASIHNRTARIEESRVNHPRRSSTWHTIKVFRLLDGIFGELCDTFSPPSSSAKGFLRPTHPNLFT
jgi:hypothetical protein